MSDLPTILLVEDDDFAATVTAVALGVDYVVRHVGSGEAALAAVSAKVPDLILLDVSMPGMTGYEVCRTLRANPAIDDLPIIFLSGMVSQEDRLAGYEAGGSDYLTKPVPAGELRTKVGLALAAHAERRRLKQDLSSAFSTAMTAMTSAAEVGSVLQFLRTSFNCPDYTVLGRELVSAVASLGFEASVQIRGQQGAVSLSQGGPCSPLEESVLANMSMQGRLFEFGTHTSCSYEHVTVIVKNMPRDDPDRHGRMKDNLALLAEGADARVVALDAGAAQAREHAALMQLVASTRETMRDIEQRADEQRAGSSTIFHDFRTRLDQLFLSLGLTQSQEDELADLVQQAEQRALALHDEGQAIGARMKGLLLQLDRASA